MTEVRLELDQLAELKELLEDDFTELVLTYVKDTTEKVAKLQALLEQNDVSAVCEVAHSIKGASLNLGVTGLSELCLQVENASRSGDISVGQQLISEIGSLSELSCQALLATLES